MKHHEPIYHHSLWLIYCLLLAVTVVRAILDLSQNNKTGPAVTFSMLRLEEILTWNPFQAASRVNSRWTQCTLKSHWVRLRHLMVRRLTANNFHMNLCFSDWALTSGWDDWALFWAAAAEEAGWMHIGAWKHSSICDFIFPWNKHVFCVSLHARDSVWISHTGPLKYQ